MNHAGMTWGLAVLGLLTMVPVACGGGDTGTTGGGTGGSEPEAGTGSGGKTQTGGSAGASTGGSIARGGGGSSGGGGTAGTAGRNGGGRDAGTGDTDASDAGGNAETGTDAGDGSVEIQTIQDGTLPLGARVTVNRVFVTALRLVSTGNYYSFMLQEPQGETPAAHVYPEYAGVSVFWDFGDSGAVNAPSVGDCIDVSGSIEDFHGLTQINLTSWQLASNCGTFPQPYAIPSTTVDFGDVATDTDPVTLGNQPGALAERYEGVLVRFSNVKAVAVGGPNGSFTIAEQSNSSGPTILVSAYFYGASPTAGDNYASLTGVFSDFDGYNVQPRGASDLVP